MEQLLEEIRQLRDARDWGKFHAPKDLAISISIEAGELLEQFQWRHDGHDVGGLDLDGVASEAADILLYTLMLFDRLGLDPTAEALRKLRRNEQRYPIDQFHGRIGSAIE